MSLLEAEGKLEICGLNIECGNSQLASAQDPADQGGSSAEQALVEQQGQNTRAMQAQAGKASGEQPSNREQEMINSAQLWQREPINQGGASAQQGPANSLSSSCGGATSSEQSTRKRVANQRGKRSVRSTREQSSGRGSAGATHSTKKRLADAETVSSSRSPKNHHVVSRSKCSDSAGGASSSSS